MIERYLGVTLDRNIAEKCRICNDRNIYSTNGSCIHGKFHGSSGDMEKSNTLQLFKNSLSLGFKYTTLVMDGDISVMPALKELAPYGPDETILKLECKNHLRKRIRTGLTGWGQGWKFSEAQVREKARVAKVERAEANAKTALEKSRRGARRQKLVEYGTSRKLIEAAMKNPKKQSVLSVLKPKNGKSRAPIHFLQVLEFPVLNLGKVPCLGRHIVVRDRISLRS